MVSITRARRLVLAGVTTLALTGAVAPTASAWAPDSPAVTTYQAPAPASSSSSGIVGTAASLVGVPYVWGGSTTAGFDCSGFTQYVYRANGLSIPRNSALQRAATRWIPQSQKVPGDLLFFSNGSGVSHVAIYVGNNTVLHAPRPGRTVSYERLWTSNYTVGRV